MKQEDIIEYCLNHLKDTVLVNSWGGKGIFYNPNHSLKRGIYVLTLKDGDGAHDKASYLDRENVYRLNIGIRKNTFLNLFHELPQRPSAGEIVAMDYDFTALDRLMPHPVYAWMGWIAVCNPTIQTFEECKPYIQEAYEFAIEKY